MFGLGFWELVVIAVVALLFIGPDKLPNFFRALGRATREFQRASRELRENLSLEEPPPGRPKPPVRRPPTDVAVSPGTAQKPQPWPDAEDAARRAREAAGSDTPASVARGRTPARGPGAEDAATAAAAPVRASGESAAPERAPVEAAPSPGPATPGSGDGPGKGA